MGDRLILTYFNRLEPRRVINSGSKPYRMNVTPLSPKINTGLSSLSRARRALGFS